VIPIIYYAKDDNISVGTAFKIENGIVTAKHCLENAKNIAIKGFSRNELNGKEIIISENSDIDVAYISNVKVDSHTAILGNGRVPQDVMVMGYPRISGFTDFLTSEKGTISAVALKEKQFTTTKGAITAFGKDIFSKTELMLITAKIRGGNSGGPVINQYGDVVGISCHVPAYEGEYDDLGYGVAIPTSTIIDIISKKESFLEVCPDYFIDFK